MAGLFGLKILLLWAGIIGLASCQGGSGSSSNNVSTTLPPHTATNAALPSGANLPVSTSPPRTATNAALPSGANLPVSTSPPRTMTATTVMSTDTSATAHTPPLTSTTLTSISPSTELKSATTPASTASPANTPPSITTKANTTQNQTSPPVTTPNNTVTPTTQATQAPPPPQCSYNVAPITFGFRIDMTNSTPGNYIINITDKGRNEPTVQSFSGTSHEIKHLKPCTEYELSVTYRDDAGNETLCNSTQSKMNTTGMSQGDIKESSCMHGYVCYQSDWDISSSLSTSVPCKSSSTELCIKPNYNDICTDLITTFTSGHCANTFSRNKTITVDFLDPKEIFQKPPTGLPAKIEPQLPKHCPNLTVDYTCQDEVGNIKNEPELEPFTDYSCTGHIKHNNVPINRTTDIKVMINCDLTITTKSKAAMTSIDLTWTATRKNCPVLPRLQNLSYDCSCVSPSKYTPSVTADKSQTGGMCHFTGLDPFTYYTCTVQPKYNNKNVASTSPVTVVQTDPGRPEDIPHVDVTFPEHNMIRVICTYGKDFKGPEKKYIARLCYNGSPQGSFVLNKTSVQHCNFEFKDLSYLTEYEVEVLAFNGHHYSNPKRIPLSTSYSIQGLIARLVVVIIASVALVVVVYKIYIPWHKKSRNDANDDMVLESTEDYVNVPQDEHRC